MNLYQLWARDNEPSASIALSPHPPNYSPTCSFPLKTYNLQFFVGFLASGGSWYLSTTPVTSGVPALDACSEVTRTVLLSAARSPEFAKLGFGGDFARSGGFCNVGRKGWITRPRLEQASQLTLPSLSSASSYLRLSRSLSPRLSSSVYRPSRGRLSCFRLSSPRSSASFRSVFLEAYPLSRVRGKSGCLRCLSRCGERERDWRDGMAYEL